MVTSVFACKVYIYTGFKLITGGVAVHGSPAASGMASSQPVDARLEGIPSSFTVIN